jgi:hypothetical protein
MIFLTFDAAIFYKFASGAYLQLYFVNFRFAAAGTARHHFSTHHKVLQDVIKKNPVVSQGT